MHSHRYVNINTPFIKINCLAYRLRFFIVKLKKYLRLEAYCVISILFNQNIMISVNMSCNSETVVI